MHGRMRAQAALLGRQGGWGRLCRLQSRARAGCRARGCACEHDDAAWVAVRRRAQPVPYKRQGRAPLPHLLLMVQLVQLLRRPERARLAFCLAVHPALGRIGGAGAAAGRHRGGAAPDAAATVVGFRRFPRCSSIKVRIACHPSSVEPHPQPPPAPLTGEPRRDHAASAPNRIRNPTRVTRVCGASRAHRSGGRAAPRVPRRARKSALIGTIIAPDTAGSGVHQRWRIEAH